jgi:hypothetical protein
VYIRLQVPTAVLMNVTAFWDIAPCILYVNRRFGGKRNLLYYFCKGKYVYVSLQVPTAVLMNVAVFWDIAPCILYVHRRFGETHHLHLHGWKSADQETSLMEVVTPNS